MTRRGDNHTAMPELSVDNIGTPAGMTSYDDMSGLASFTNYTALEGEMSTPAIEDDFLDEANITVPYSKQKRGHGEGVSRLGTSLTLQENIYSLAFVAQLSNWTIDKVTEKEGSDRPECVHVQQTPRGGVSPIDFVDADDPSFLE